MIEADGYREEGRQFPYLNRELSWIEFNARVLGEGLRKENPLLERLKFLSIVSSNFDEFFMIRYASLKRLAQSGKQCGCPSRISIHELIERIHTRVRELTTLQYDCLTADILPRLADGGVALLRPGMYDGVQAEYLKNLFRKEIFPVLTPVKVTEGKRFPLAGNKRLHLAFELTPVSGASAEKETRVAILQIPTSIDRLIVLPGQGKRVCFTLIEDVILSEADMIFLGYSVRSAMLFRVTRDADLGVDEERDEDFMEAMEQIVASREHSAPVRLEVSTNAGAVLRDRLVKMLSLDPEEVYSIPGPIDLQVFMDMAGLPGHDQLRYEEWRPVVHPLLGPESDIWDVIRKQDILLHHPYDSFDPVLRFITEAAHDPQVLAIKMTLYRTSGRSPIIRALTTAAENGKQVTVLVELKARFDEERNINWAHHLERAGAIVVYGIAKLKVHAKALLVVRREATGSRRYVHLATGNYNDKTARLYTDMGLFSAREDLAYEVTLFFNAITGYSSVPMLRKLIMAPIALKDRIIALVEREAERSTPENPGVIMAKMNALADPEVIAALYRASCRGVRILLNVRGVCMLVPGVPGLSENIRVVSIIDRYLEHSRILYLHNGSADEVYLSSADWMPRNLERRVELMFPVEQEDLKARVITAMKLFFEDTTNSWVLDRDGAYTRVQAENGENVHAQKVFHEKALQRLSREETVRGAEFVVRRKPPKIT